MINIVWIACALLWFCRRVAVGQLKANENKGSAPTSCARSTHRGDRFGEGPPCASAHHAAPAA